jgi:hypothetical protein
MVAVVARTVIISELDLVAVTEWNAGAFHAEPKLEAATE